MVFTLQDFKGMFVHFSTLYVEELTVFRLRAREVIEAANRGVL